jgi:hypothetical protein
VPAEIEPAELARLVDFAERPRVQDWSLRAALVRYASPEPRRVDSLLDLVRRVDWALGKQSSVLQREGPEVWTAFATEGEPDDALLAPAVRILRVASDLDRLGDVLAEWATDIRGPDPDAAVDATIASVGPRLDELGIPHEERPPPRSRG